MRKEARGRQATQVELSRQTRLTWGQRMLAAVFAHPVLLEAYRLPFGWRVATFFGPAQVMANLIIMPDRSRATASELIQQET